jgi:hypothetical protein
MEYGTTAHNRIVCVNRLFGGLGYVRLGHGCAIPTPHSTTFFCARKNASHFFLSGAKKCRIQPERYVQVWLEFGENIDFYT